MDIKLVIVLCTCGAVVTSYPNDVLLDEDTDFRLRWIFNDVNITFEISAHTHGWIGLGFSNTGGMKDSDIIMMWFEGGKAHLLDMFATNNGVPQLDHQNDLLLLAGFENETHTGVVFNRKLKTCDDKDLQITESTIQVLWAISYSDMTTELAPDLYDIHSDVNRGSKSLRLLNNRMLPSSNEETSSFNIVTHEVLIPPTHTYYHCRIVHLKKFNGNKHHIVRVDPIIQEGHERLVHHMILYLCAGVHYSDYADEYGESCYSNMPSDYVDCMTPIGGWAVGGTSFAYPEEVGLPLELAEKNHNLYFMIEIHYDNPSRLDNIFDSSGLRIHYTSKLRKYDAGVLLAGHTVTPLQIIPTGASSWLTQGHCTSECIDELFAEHKQEEVSVFATHLHSHLAARKMTFRIVRNGKEMKPLQADDNYDVNYQEIQLLRHKTKILKGDRLIVDCVYDTSDRDYLTFGGLSSDNEMCLGFLWYYPKSSLQTCTSAPSAGELYRSLGVNKRLLSNVDPYEPWISHAGMRALRNIIRSGNRPDEIKELNKIVLNTSIAFDCKTDHGFIMSQSKVPVLLESYNEEEVCSSVSSFSMLGLFQASMAFSAVLFLSMTVSYFSFKYWKTSSRFTKR